MSNNSGFSEHPQILAYDNNVYAIWADDTSGNREVLFTRSVDNGTSFDKIKTSATIHQTHLTKKSQFLETLFMWSGWTKVMKMMRQIFY